MTQPKKPKNKRVTVKIVGIDETRRKFREKINEVMGIASVGTTTGGKRSLTWAGEVEGREFSVSEAENNTFVLIDQETWRKTNVSLIRKKGKPLFICHSPGCPGAKCIHVSAVVDAITSWVKAGYLGAVAVQDDGKPLFEITPIKAKKEKPAKPKTIFTEFEI